MNENNSNNDIKNYNITNLKEKRLIINEKGYSGYLCTLGKIDYFEEKLFEKKLSDDIIKKIIPLENPRQQASFIEGQQIARALVKQGFTKENYVTFLKTINKKLQEKLKDTEIIKNIGHR